MPSFLGNPFANYFKRILQFGHSGNNGTPTSTTNIQSGDGVATSVSLSDDVLQVQPVTDNTTGTMLVKNQGGDTVFAVDTTNKKVQANGVNTTTQYVNFGVSSGGGLAAIAGTHYAVPYSHMISATAVTMGTSADPATSYDISANNNGDDMAMMLWYVPDDITIDQVYWMAGGSAASGDTINIHLMSYDFDAGTGAGKGDLSNGAVVAGGADIASLGYENIVQQSIAPASADVDAGKVCMATFESNGTNSDYSINITVKYHLR